MLIYIVNLALTSLVLGKIVKLTNLAAWDHTISFYELGQENKVRFTFLTFRIQTET